MRTSEQINELAAALAAAQGEFINPERNREVAVTMKNGGTYTFRYSTLDCVMDMARPILSKHGLAITQPPTVRDNEVVVLTRLMHSSGQWQEEEIPVQPESFGAQAIGSAITYLKRYAYCGMLGIAPDEDDDGNGADGNKAQIHQPKTKPACPKCGTAKAVIQGKEEYGGGWVCFQKKGGCGHKWHDEPQPHQSPQQRTQDLANQHGMKTGADVGPSKEQVDALEKYRTWFASAWTDEAFAKVVDKLKEEKSQWLLSQLKIVWDEAQRRVQLLAAESIDGDTFDQVLLWVDKTPVLRDLEKFLDTAINANPSPFNEEQKERLYSAFEKRQQRKG